VESRQTQPLTKQACTPRRTVDFIDNLIRDDSNWARTLSGGNYQLIELAVMGEVKAQFRPEFVNRIDEIVIFHALDEKNITLIAKLQLGLLKKLLTKMEIKAKVRI